MFLKMQEKLLLKFAPVSDFESTARFLITEEVLKTQSKD